MTTTEPSSGSPPGLSSAAEKGGAAESTGVGSAVDEKTLRLDYTESLATWRMLVDVRFRLLTLVPTITGIGVAFLARRPGYESSLVAGLALMALFGIVIYDLRNSAFHDSAIHRAKELEILMGASRLSDKGTGAGGLVNERPRDKYRLLGVKVWHDRGLFLIYAAAAAGWVALLCLGILGGLGFSIRVMYLGAGAAAACSFAVALAALHVYDKRVSRPASLRLPSVRSAVISNGLAKR